MLKHIKSFVRDESGATLIEYGLVAVLIAVAAIAALRTVGNSTSNTFNNIGTTLSN
jgi:pilus assembly protein Flp/PilA